MHLSNQDNLSRFVRFLIFLFSIIKGLPHSGLPLQYVQLFFSFPLNLPEVFHKRLILSHLSGVISASHVKQVTL